VGRDYSKFRRVYRLGQECLSVRTRAGGLAGMNLETVALDFYDRNCFDCKQRAPVRRIVAERDASRQREADARAKSEEALAQGLALRAALRRQLSKGSDPAKAGILGSIEAFDNDPSDKNRRILLETAASVPDRFDSAVQESLYQIADGGGFARTDGAREMLNALPTDPVARRAALAARSQLP
jgi:hypothetical protein